MSGAIAVLPLYAFMLWTVKTVLFFFNTAEDRHLITAVHMSLVSNW